MRAGKSDSAWVRAVWVGRVDRSNEHLLLTTKGCISGETHSRRQQASYHAEVQRLPWDQTFRHAQQRQRKSADVDWRCLEECLQRQSRIIQEGYICLVAPKLARGGNQGTRKDRHEANQQWHISPRWDCILVQQMLQARAREMVKCLKTCKQHKKWNGSSRC